MKIRRKQESFNQHIGYKVFVDNLKVTELKNGEEKIIEFDEDARYLEVKITSGSSEKWALNKIKSGQEILVFENRFRNKYLKYAGALIPMISLTFILKHNYELIKILGGIIFILYLLFIIFLLFFKRNKWIHLQIVN